MKTEFSITCPFCGTHLKGDISPDTKREAKKINSNEYVLLTKYFEPTHDMSDENFYTTSQIVEDLSIYTSSRLRLRKLGLLLRELKFVRVKRYGMYGYLLKEKRAE